MDSQEKANIQQDSVDAGSPDEGVNVQVVGRSNVDSPTTRIKLGNSVKVAYDENYAAGQRENNGNGDSTIKLSSTVKDSETEKESKKSNATAKSNSDATTGLNINQAISINIKRKMPKQVDAIMQLVCACLNFNTFITLELKNEDFKTAETKHFDEWYDRIEKKMKLHFDDTPADLIKLDKSSHCNSEYILLQICPAKFVCSLDTYLYFPSVSSVDQVKNEKAIGILTQKKHFGELPSNHDKSFIYKRTVEGLRREHVDVQFKEVTSKNIPRAIADMVSKYISAFANHKGGCIYFGIEDKQALVVGVDLSNTDEEDIVNSLEERIKKMQWIHSPLSMKKGKHWDIRFAQIAEKPADLKEKLLKVIVVSVAEIPGGVFTAVPESYYADNDGNVLPYLDLTKWKQELINSYKEFPATKADLQETNEKLDLIQKEKAGNPNIWLSKTDTVIRKANNITDWMLVRNPIHTERNYNSLSEYMTSKKCVVLKGMVGTGKTELALKYCCHVSKKKDTWIFKCTDKFSLELSMREICHCLSIHEVPKNQDEEFQDKVIEKLAEVIVTNIRNERQDINHIFLFDDVKEMTRFNVDGFLHKCLCTYNIKCIVTSVLAIEPEDDVRIIEITGFTDDEALDFLREGKKLNSSEREDANQLARKFSCNPKGLHIARTYMKHLRLTIGGFIKRLKLPSDILKVEESRVIKRTVSNQMFSSLITILHEIHQQYQEENQLEVFEMLLMLQYLHVEKIPVTIFSNINTEGSRMGADDLLHVIDNCSLGTVEGEDDGMYDCRLLSTHDLVVSALAIYCEREDVNISLKKELDEKLLGSLFLLMDKDNESENSFKHHTLLLPHARAVIDHLNKKTPNVTSNVCLQNTELIVKMIYMNDIVGFISSYSETCTFSHLYFEQAKCFLFQMLNLDVEKFNAEINASCESLTDIESMTKVAMQYALPICKAILNFVQNKDQMQVLQKVAKEYLLNKNRNAADVELLKCKLRKTNLERRTKLTEDEYKQLIKEGNAIPEYLLGAFFLYEIVTSFFYTYGRLMFYLPGSSKPKEARFFCLYLYIAQRLHTCLCNNQYGSNLEKEQCSESPLDNDTKESSIPKAFQDTANPYRNLVNFDILSTMHIERSVIQSTMDPGLEITEPDYDIFQANLTICEDRSYESKNYIEFGIVKLNTDRNDFNKMLWLKQITRVFRVLLSNNTNLHSEGLKLAAKLSKEIQKMENRMAYPSLQISLGELYLDLGETKLAESCFSDLIPSFEDTGIEILYLNKYQRRACINYIKCRIENYQDKHHHLETLAKITAYSRGLTSHTRQLEKMQKLEIKLSQKLKSTSEQESL